MILTYENFVKLTFESSKGKKIYFRRHTFFLPRFYFPWKQGLKILEKKSRGHTFLLEYIYILKLFLEI